MPTLEPDISILGNGINFKILLSEKVTLTFCAHATFLKKCCVGKKLLRRQKTQINVEIFIWKLKIKHLLNPLTGTRINFFKIFFTDSNLIGCSYCLWIRIFKIWSNSRVMTHSSFFDFSYFQPHMTHNIYIMHMYEKQILWRIQK